MSKLNPINGFVLLKPVEEQEKTYGAIIVPDLGSEKPEIGEVVATSSTYNYHKGEIIQSALTVGQKVLIPKMGSMKISVEAEDFFITKETDILAIFN